MELLSQEADFLPTRENLVLVGECGLDERGNHIERTYYIQFYDWGSLFFAKILKSLPIANWDYLGFNTSVSLSP